jgi:hypothetical protein
MSTTDDLRDALAADDGSLPERWNAEDVPGTTLVGTLLRFESIVTNFGEMKIAVIEDADDGTTWGVGLGRAVLKKKFETLDPQPGDTVGLKYVGFSEPRSKDANGYHNYAMKVMHTASAGGAVKAETTESSDDELPF